MYLEMIFGRNKEQTTRELQFILDPLLAGSTEIYLFHQRWIKTFHTQPFGQLCIKYGLVFYKNDMVQFCKKYMVGPSQKNLFWALEKWKIEFSCKENKNSLCQYCLQMHDVNLCKIWYHLNKYLIGLSQKNSFWALKNGMKILSWIDHDQFIRS